MTSIVFICPSSLLDKLFTDFFFFFFKQKTAYEMRIRDWSSDVCSSDLDGDAGQRIFGDGDGQAGLVAQLVVQPLQQRAAAGQDDALVRSEEHTSELQSLMRISYAVFCLKKKK